MTAVASDLARYRRASDYVNGLIQGPPAPPPGLSTEEIRGRALARMDRLRRFLRFIGDPQRRFRSIHIGGTSGKGSTSALTAGILTAAGYRTGLHVTPYLQVETEKLQINGRLMPAGRFADQVFALAELAQRWRDSGGERLTYGEFWVALTFKTFADEQVEFAVIEVGAGGRFDLTNLLEPDVAVITSVGIDHVRTLGSTIPEIAWHKAGIIKPGIPAVTTVADAEALAVIEAEARLQRAPLTILRAGRDYALIESDAVGTRLRDLHSGRDYVVQLPGGFQAANAAAAIAAVGSLSLLPRGPLTPDVIGRGLAETRFPGRVEIVQRRPLVILDGAHNPAKMEALVGSFGSLGRPARRLLLLGSLNSHDYLSTAAIVARVADEIVITAPSAVERASASTETLAEVAARVGVPVEVIDDPSEAIETVLRRATPEDQVVVTGSLYLVGMVRERWYPSEAILLAGSSWPEQPTKPDASGTAP